MGATARRLQSSFSHFPMRRDRPIRAGRPAQGSLNRPDREVRTAAPPPPVAGFDFET